MSLSFTHQLEAIEENYRCIAIDDDHSVLNYYNSIFLGAESDNGLWDILAEVMEEGGGQALLENRQEPSLPFELTTVASGESGVEQVRIALDQGKPYSVALVDMRMPGGIDGLETARRLRGLDPRIMLVFVTAYSDHRIHQIQLERDVLYLNKPLSSDEVVQTVRMLNGSWKEREKGKLMELQLVSQAKMASLGNMAIRIGHEINQPLSYIGGLLQLQRVALEEGEEIDPKVWIDELELALVQTRRIKEIIDSLRVFAHPDHKQRQSIQIDEALDHVRKLFRLELESKRVRLLIEIPQELPMISANASQLQRIFTNLTNNALDALEQVRSQRGAGWEPTLRILAQPLKGGVELIFGDNGEGIPEPLIARIFDPFVTTKEPGQGTGLGLSEVHGMLREHGATISYSSDPELGGARFTIQFPKIAEVDENNE